jgi:hypothetical protein
MSNTLSRAKTLAHIASIASKSKIEDSDVLFFKDGVYKGEWNPNAVANNLPANTQQNDIFLVSDTGSYYGRTLLVGDLVRFVGQDKPILVYSKYLPIPFFLSMLDEPQQAGGGFAYGGEFNAIPTSTYVDAAFDVLQFCTDSGSTLTPLNASPYGAMITNISDADAGTNLKARFTWPDTSGGNAFFVGFAVTESHYPVNEVSSPSSTIIGIGAMDGANILLRKQSQDQNVSPLTSTLNVGDVIVIGYRAAIRTVYITNESHGGSTVATINLSSYPAFTDTSMSLMVYSTVAAGINYNFNDPANYNLQRELLEFYIPSDLAKTYHVEATNYKSVIHGKRLKEGDFVNFFDDGTGAIDVAISRLISNDDVKQPILIELQNITSDIHVAVHSIANDAITAALANDGNGVIFNAIQAAINP